MILIGVVFTGDPRMQQVFRGNYGKAVRRGGGVPVFLPWKPKHAAFWAKHLDGFLFTGGGDPDPRYYGQSMRPECGTPTPARDEFELALLKPSWIRESRFSASAGGSRYSMWRWVEP